MKLYSAFDVHSKNNFLGIIDGDGKRIFRRKLSNDPQGIRETLEPYKEEMVGIVVESTYNWYWIVDVLMEEGYRVHLANPSAIQQYSGLKHADDEHDAFWLAEITVGDFTRRIYLSQGGAADSRSSEKAGTSGQTADLPHYRFAEYCQ